MLPLDDPLWKSFRGGYGEPYDASPVLCRLFDAGPAEVVWAELWNELHHQGDVNQASYAAVPWLVEYISHSPKLDWNPLALVAAIELARDLSANPDVDAELSEGYFAAIQRLPEILGAHPDHTWSDEALRTAMACIALARGSRWFARAYFELDRDTAGRWFSEELGWDFPDA